MNATGNAILRVVLAKAGLDAHERGMHVVSLGLRDHGFEVISLPLRRTPAEIAETALQEDADIIGISSLAGSHLSFVRAVRAELDRRELDVVLVVGGVIPASDVPELRQLGVAEVFGQGALVRDISARLRELTG